MQFPDEKFHLDLGQMDVPAQLRGVEGPVEAEIQMFHQDEEFLFNMVVPVDVQQQQMVVQVGDDPFQVILVEVETVDA